MYNVQTFWYQEEGALLRAFVRDGLYFYANDLYQLSYFSHSEIDGLSLKTACTSTFTRFLLMMIMKVVSVGVGSSLGGV